MKLVTPKQMREIDLKTINGIGIPGIVLMENAALRVVEEIIKILGGLRGKRIIVLAGKGNNGGDAFAAARHLVNGGADTKIYLVAKKQLIEGDARINLDILLKMGVEITEVDDGLRAGSLAGPLSSADIVVDGLLGTGLKGSVEGVLSDVIKAVNAAGKKVVSIDMPSGVDGETGKVCGSCIKAYKTVTFGFPKIGQVVHPGCEYVGELVTADIGIPPKVVEEMDIKTGLIDEGMVVGIIPGRFGNSNKGDYGKVFIVSGSIGMTGAGCLAAEAALRSGAGLVYLGVPSTLTPVYDALLLESVTIPLEDNGNGVLSKSCAPRIFEQLKRATVAAVGPGLSINDEITELLELIIENCAIPLILDADALNAVSRDVSVLKKLKTQTVVTPHPGEMARLAGISVSEVQDNRIEVAREFAIKWKATVVLKGSRTVVALPDSSIYINLTGNSGMATGGAGDILTGLIAGFAAQGVALPEAAIAGVFVHGRAGDNAAKVKGEHGMIASDILKEVPFVIRKMARMRTRKE